MIFQIGRVWFDVMIFACLLIMLGSRYYELLVPPIQLLTLKAILVSAGFMHAHIMRKLAFPSVEWIAKKDSQSEQFHLKWMVICLYVMVIFAYAKGG